MAAIKPIDQSAAKWSARAAVAGPDYIRGVQNPRTPWAAAAAAAEGNYGAGVTAAVSAKRYSTGIRKAGDAKWSANSAAKGPTRFAEGVAMALGAWTTAFQPFQAAIASLTLPTRGPTGSAQNLQRVQAITSTLRAVKTGQK